MFIVKWIDAIGKWLLEELSAHAQLRMGVILVLLSIPLMIYGPFSGEQFLIYEMSAFALTLSGVGIVVGAQVLVHEENKKEE